MAIRWRDYGRGDLVCAAKYPEEPNDCYIDDALHYRLSVILQVLMPLPDDKWEWLPLMGEDELRWEIRRLKEEIARLKEKE